MLRFTINFAALRCTSLHFAELRSLLAQAFEATLFRNSRCLCRLPLCYVTNSDTDSRRKITFPSVDADGKVVKAIKLATNPKQ